VVEVPSGLRGAVVTTGRRSPLLLLLLALAIGVVDGLVYLAFEWVVHDGTDWLWNDLFDSDTDRWQVLVLATLGSVVFSGVLWVFHEKRATAAHFDLFSATAPPAGITVATIGQGLLIGAVSLLAGASLGPEAALVAASISIGGWFATRGKAGELGPLLVLASVGALLVAFLGSLIAMALPVLLLVKRTKRVTVAGLLPILVAGLAAYGTLWLVQGDGDGYGSVPVGSNFEVRDLLAALVVGALAAVATRGLTAGVAAGQKVVARLTGAVPWPVASAAFGLVLGGLYLVGGETVQFSGSQGSTQLLARSATYSTAALAGLVVVKLLATAWSLASGFRGGNVFPSIYVGVALGLFAARIASDVSGPGIVVGAVAGILTAMLGAPAAAIMLMALLPLKLIAVVAAGAVGALLGVRLLDRVAPPSPAS
jgi:H+/Cl- antiporter ClcA